MSTRTWLITTRKATNWFWNPRASCKQQPFRSQAVCTEELSRERNVSSARRDNNTGVTQANRIHNEKMLVFNSSGSVTHFCIELYYKQLHGIIYRNVPRSLLVQENHPGCAEQITRWLWQLLPVCQIEVDLRKWIWNVQNAAIVTGLGCLSMISEKVKKMSLFFKEKKNKTTHYVSTLVLCVLKDKMVIKVK